MRKFINRSKFIWLSTAILLFAVIALYPMSNRINGNLSHNGSTTIANIDAINEKTLTAQASSAISQKATDVDVKGGMNDNRAMTYRGVSFNYNTSLASEIKAETRPAYALEYETDTGQGVAPEHIAFKFIGPYASQHESSFFSPEITVYPIVDYKKALSKSKRAVQRFEDEIQTLRMMLSEQPDIWEKVIPFLPFEVGASQRFHARLKYVDFQNGKGMFFLTQYNIEPSLINNEGLTYTFQGITDDNIYYVSAIFPVSAPFLPKSYEAESSEGYTLNLPRSFRGPEYESFDKNYKIYLAEVIKKLEHMSSDSFQPNLTALEDLIHSLNVKIN